VSGCISVKLNQREKQRSQSYEFQAPPAIFQVLPTDFADHAWQSKKTANSLVVITECGTLADQDLQKIANEHLLALQSIEIQKQNFTTFSERQTFFAIAKGKLDGVEVKMAIQTTNKNGCNYTITYLGRQISFAEEFPLWESFISGFKIK
jgi:hypothetical protein